MNRNLLKTPTGRRQTSWLFTKRAGVEFGATEDKSIQWQGGGLEPGIKRFCWTELNKKIQFNRTTFGSMADIFSSFLKSRLGFLLKYI